MHDHDHRNPIHCILPPYILASIQMRGDEKLRRIAERSEKASDKTRAQRQTISPLMTQPATPEIARTQPASSREVYDGRHKVALPGELVRSEGDPPVKDEMVNQVYALTGKVFDFYLDVFNRNSIDNQGMTIISTVHHRRKFNNAFWNGSQMVFGDGDGILFTSFADLSIIGHELSHGVVQYSGGLMYKDQSGALNESFADVFGVMTEQYANKQTVSEASWLVGEHLFGPDVEGVALRSLKAPGLAYDDDILGKDPQPFHMDLYVNTSSDYGGVHINSGIPNHAFYLLAQYLGGYSWEKAGQIWYQTMQRLKNPMATFADWADMTVQTAWDLYGKGSFELQMTRRAWRLVGIHL
jgi:Zn-dependent metalloprotease